MANINQFTSQSGWVNAYSISVPTITTAVPDLVEINYIANNLIVNSLFFLLASFIMPGYISISFFIASRSMSIVL